MKEAKMVKALFIMSMVLAVLVGTVAAQVQPLSPGIVITDVTAINDEVLPGETATYNVSVTSITVVTEYVNFTIEPERTGWTYSFDPEGFDIAPFKMNYSILSIAVPSGATPGDYYHNVTAWAWMEGVPFPVESSIYTGVKTTVISFPKRVPTLTPIGITALVGLLAIVAVSRIRKKK